MRIIVCIKQVPLVEQLTFNAQEGRIVREGAPREVNPFDRRALTKAVALQQAFGGEVVALTMGPLQAREALYEALAMGAQEAVHLLGREFAGSDTLATARALAAACRRLGFDLILCGKYSTDSETGQTPAMVAELLGIPHILAVTALDVAADGQAFTAVQETDEGFQTLRGDLPALMSTGERLLKPAKVTPEQIAAAASVQIASWGVVELGLEPAQLGAAGSPTRVSSIYRSEPLRKHVLRTVNGDAPAVAHATVQDLVAEGLFGAWQWSAEGRAQTHTVQGKLGRAVWVLAEVGQTGLRPVTSELLGRGGLLAQRLGGELAAVLIGHDVERHVPELAAYGAARVYLADAPALASPLSEASRQLLADAIQAHRPFALLAPSTTAGRDLVARVAARLELGLTSDCIGLEVDENDRLVQMKPAFGGSIVATVLTRTQPALATVRPGVLEKVQPNPALQATVQRLPLCHLPPPRLAVVSSEYTAGSEFDAAEIIVGVGMGIGGPDRLGPVQDLAAALGGVVAATRKVVDAGWLQRQLQIGLTGRSVAPKLYVAVGVSGKFNHTVGIQRARVVLAINNQREAEIFQHADYGIVGDWAEVAPALTEEIRRVRAGV